MALCERRGWWKEAFKSWIPTPPQHAPPFTARRRAEYGFVENRSQLSSTNRSKFCWPPLLSWETGRIRFRGARFQSPSSVSCFGLTELQGVNSVSSFQPLICVPKGTHRDSRRTLRVLLQNALSSLFRNSTLATVFHPFPISAYVVCVPKQPHRDFAELIRFGHKTPRVSLLSKQLFPSVPNPMTFSLLHKVTKTAVHGRILAPFRLF